jgi:hypothetical protein
MINIGALDTHIDPYTQTNEYSSEPPVAVCYFSFPCSGIPVIKSQSVWPDDDGYRNTERAQRYLSIIGGANSNLELSSYLTYFPMNP